MRDAMQKAHEQRRQWNRACIDRNPSGGSS